MEIFVGGYPSLLGGGDTECLNNVILLRKYGVNVNCVPMFGCDYRVQKYLDSIGVKTLPYHPKIFKDKVVASWCNGEFLKHLPEIAEQGKPATVIFFNCMTRPFAKEIQCHVAGLIDLHGFVSKYQRSILKPEIEKHKPLQEFEGYRPYFDPENRLQGLEFRYNQPDKWFAVGRISRDDSAKYPSDMWQTFFKVCTPQLKKVFVLGWGPNAEGKCGHHPKGMDVQVFPPNAVPAKQVYQLLHAIIHKTGGSRESYCRIAPEAFASGVPFICENDFAFPELIENGVTGYMCKSSDEMSFRASELAFNEEARKKMVFKAREYLVNNIADAEKCWEPWKRLLKTF